MITKYKIDYPTEIDEAWNRKAQEIIIKLSKKYGGKYVLKKTQ